MMVMPSETGVPNYTSRDISTARIGISINELQSPYYGAIVDGALLYLKERGVNAIVHLNSHLRTGELEAWEFIRNKHFDSCLVHCNHLTDDELAMLMGEHANVVLLNRCIPGFDKRCVRNDCNTGGAMAALYLLENGHTELAVVTGPSSYHQTQLRTDGFNQALKSWNQEVPEALFLESDFTEFGGALAMEEILDHTRNFSAVFFQNDEMAVGALEYCYRNKILVPQSMSVIGFDGLKIGQFVAPKLTTIKQPLRLIGREAGRIALNLIDTSIDSERENVVNNSFVPALVEGGSVRSIADLVQMVRLTRREKECLEWSAHGKTAWEIGRILGISVRTVNNHLSNSFKRLSVTNRSEAIAKSIREGLIDI